MKIISARTLIRDVAKRWKEQYVGWWVNDPKHFSIVKLEKLNRLDKETATEQDVENIIGNNSWTQRTCHECHEDVDLLIHLGEEPDYESRTFYICQACLVKALDMIHENTTYKFDGKSE